MTAEELEIREFYREGMTFAQLSLATEYSVYRLKKLLANEPATQPLGYIYRSLFPSCKSSKTTV